MKRCIYSIILPEAGICCNVYNNAKRPDGKWWAHWPKCTIDKCPILNPELLEGAVFDKENYKMPPYAGDFINCADCLFWEDCENKESRDGCYCGEKEDNFNEKAI